MRSTLSSLKTPPPEWGFSRIARATLRATMDPTKAPSAPLHADPPVLISRPGVCGFCGLGTAFACPKCRTVHFCGAGCLERGRDHACGAPFCRAVNLPSSRALDRSSGSLTSCWINAYLRGGGRFSLHPPSLTQQPNLSYGLVPLTLSAKAAADLSKVVIEERDHNGYLKIGTNSYPGYANYTAIPGVVCLPPIPYTYPYPYPYP